MAPKNSLPAPPAPRPTRRTVYGLASVADVPATRARAALERGLSAVPASDRERIAAGGRAIGMEILDRADGMQRAYRDIEPDDDGAA
jgi:hypothetical protein